MLQYPEHKPAPAVSGRGETTAPFQTKGEAPDTEAVNDECNDPQDGDLQTIDEGDEFADPPEEALDEHDGEEPQEPDDADEFSELATVLTDSHSPETGQHDPRPEILWATQALIG